MLMNHLRGAAFRNEWYLCLTVESIKKRRADLINQHPFVINPDKHKKEPTVMVLSSQKTGHIRLSLT